MITKVEMQKKLGLELQNEVDILVKRFDAELRKSWDGKSVQVPYSKVKVDSAIFSALEEKLAEAGWKLHFVNGGYDQRDGDWNGHFVIS